MRRLDDPQHVDTLHLHHSVPAGRWGKSSRLGVGVAAGCPIPGVVCKHLVRCLARISAEQAASELSLVVSGQQCLESVFASWTVLHSDLTGRTPRIAGSYLNELWAKDV